MLIIAKFLLKNIMEKKTRTFLVILSIMISATLSLATLVTSNNLQTMYSKQITKYFGKSDLMITKVDSEDTQFFNPNSIDDFKDRLEYTVGEINGQGVYKNKNVYVRMNLFGVDLKEVQRMINITLYKEENINPFNGNKIIISKMAAEKYNFETGSTLELEIANVKQKFLIVGIAQPEGVFMEAGQELAGIVPREVLGNLYNSPGNVNVMYMKTKNPEQKQQLIKELSETFKQCVVSETITDNEMKTYIDRMATSFKQLMIAVLLISIFIIYSSFKVISIERLPIIGTFRSIGAAKGTTNLIVCLESILYGIIGGALGCVLGIIVSKVMVIFTVPQWLQYSSQDYQISFKYILLTFVLAIVISFVSSIFPIVKVSRYPLKEVILNKIESSQSRNNINFVLGSVLMICGFIVPKIVPDSLALVLNTICAVIEIIAIILLIPGLLRLLTIVFEKINELISANVGSIAAKNLRDNNSVANSISLLAIGIAVLMLINSFGSGLIKRITDYYSEQTYEIQMVADQANESTERSILSVSGVKKGYGLYEANDVIVEGKREKIRLIMGVNGDFFDYFNYKISWDKSVTYGDFNNGRNIVLSNTLMKLINAKLGDNITLNMKKSSAEYKIVGFVEAPQSFALMPREYLKADMDLLYYSRILVKSSGATDKIAEEIRNKYFDLKPQVDTIISLKESDLNANKQLVLAMQAFSIIVLLIGTVGVINNFIVSFIERRRYFAVLRSVGMEKKQIIKMIFIESALGGLVAGMVGILGGLLLLSILPSISEAIGLKVNVEYSLQNCAFYLMISIVVSLIASISPALKSSKFNIIESIKYE